MPLWGYGSGRGAMGAGRWAIDAERWKGWCSMSPDGPRQVGFWDGWRVVRPRSKYQALSAKHMTPNLSSPSGVPLHVLSVGSSFAYLLTGRPDVVLDIRMFFAYPPLSSALHALHDCAVSTDGTDAGRTFSTLTTTL